MYDGIVKSLMNLEQLFVARLTFDERFDSTKSFAACVQQALPVDVVD